MDKGQQAQLMPADAEKRSDFLAGDDESAAKNTSQWVTFTLADETYAVNVLRVQEVLKVADIAPVPGAPPYVLGIVNLRGNVVPVVDTRMRMSLPPRQPDDSTRIVIIEVNEEPVGMMVDAVAEVVELDDEAVDAAPSAASEDGARYIHGVVSKESDLLILLDVDRLLENGFGGSSASGPSQAAPSTAGSAELF